MFTARYGLNLWVYFKFNFVLKIKIKIALEQAMKAQRGNRGIVLVFL